MNFGTYMLLSVFKIKQLCLQSQQHLLTMKASQEVHLASNIKTVHVRAPYEANALSTRDNAPSIRQKRILKSNCLSCLPHQRPPLLPVAFS